MRSGDRGREGGGAALVGRLYLVGVGMKSRQDRHQKTQDSDVKIVWIFAKLGSFEKDFLRSISELPTACPSLRFASWGKCTFASVFSFQC